MFSEALIRNIPDLIAWGAGIVLAAVMVRRGGGLAEKLLLAGCCLTFALNLAGPLLTGLLQSFGRERGLSNIEIARNMAWVSLPTSIVGLAGLVCLVWAFWSRFWIKRRKAA